MCDLITTQQCLFSQSLRFKRNPIILEFQLYVMLGILISSLATILITPNISIIVPLHLYTLKHEYNTMTSQGLPELFTWVQERDLCE